jgi:hypothetical protein
MKIGILTYHRAHNYGALLQAYALRSFLEKIGHNVEFVDYWPDYHKEEYKILSIKVIKKYSWLGRVKFLTGFIIGFSRIIKRRNGYIRFMKLRLNLTDKTKFNKATEIDSSYDVIIYGSDQIWRKQKLFSCQGFDEIYFGSRLKNVQKRISYAASMGEIDLDNNDLAFIKDHLNNFDAISVREENLKETISKIGFNSILALDPVFFLNKNEWSKIACNKPSIQREKYIFFYQLNNSIEAELLVNNLKNELKCKVVEIQGEVAPFCFGKRYFQTACPEHFLSLIKNAEFVVSTSFHGVAFSVIFEKQFYALGLDNNSGRVQTLLSSLSIGNRYLQNIDNIDFKEQINYSKVKEELNNLINISALFIQNSLNKEI